MIIKGRWYDVLSEVCEYLKNARDKEVTIAIWYKETIEQRTISQNSTFYRLFSWIWKHLWEDTQTIKIYFLIWCFWSRKINLSKTEMEIPIISETSKLNKEQWILLIDTLIRFTKKHNIPCEITPKELQSLYNSFEK